jgi:hypothetical protein
MIGHDGPLEDQPTTLLDSVNDRDCRDTRFVKSESHGFMLLKLKCSSVRCYVIPITLRTKLVALGAIAIQAERI